METNGKILIYYGDGPEKSMAALGKALQMAGSKNESRVCMIPFLQGKNSRLEEFLGRLEPEIKCFNFARAQIPYEELDPENRLEESMNLKNCFHFAKKTVATGEYDLVVLDEILDLIDLQLVTEEELGSMFLMKPDEVSVIMTGRHLPDSLKETADQIRLITSEK